MSTRIYHCSLVASGIVMVLLSAGALRAQQQQQERIIQLGPGGAAAGGQEFMDPFAARPGAFTPGPVSNFMIGISATPVGDDVRAHVDLPDGAGLIVGEVIADAPAGKAGIERYDILVLADGKKLKSMEQLIDAVDKHGKDESAVTLEVLRKGETMNFEVTPSKRPQVAQAESGMPSPGVDPFGPQMFQFRGLGPMVMGAPGGMAGMAAGLPNGVSIQMQKSGDGPTKITVKRGEEEWTVEGDDEEALAQLPDDIRPLVEGMVKSNRADVLIPGFPGGPGGQGWAVPAIPGPAMAPPVPDASLDQRLRDMEQQIEQLRQALEEQE